MIILGIDPGFALLGYGVIENNNNKNRLIDYGVISTDKDMSPPLRLKTVGDGMKALIEKFKPDALAVEELFFNSNQKTAINVAQARGVIIFSAVSLNVSLYEYTPLQIKQGLTGYGRADKNQIQQMVKVLLNLRDIPRPDDAADALAVAICHTQTNSMSKLFKI